MVAVFSLALYSLAGSPAMADERQLLKYCKADVERLCAGIEPGGGRLIECLKANKEGMSVGCAQALMKLKEKAGK
jgi:hypothetical protein